MIRLRTHATPAVILAAVALLALLVLRDDPPASWVSVQAPAAVVIGEPFTATVTLLEPMDGVFLDFDLHGEDARRHPLRCVAAGTTVPVSSAQCDYTFTLVLRDRPDLDRVHAVIYLSKTGTWHDQFRVARSDPFSVVRNSAGSPRGTPLALEVHDQIPDPAIEIPNPAAARAVIAVVWMCSAVLATLAWRRLPRPRRFPALVFFLALFALWEATAAADWISELARSFAQAGGLYEDRRTFQQAATAVGLCFFGLIAAIGLRRSRQEVPGLALAGFALYATVALAGMLSLHEVDRILATAIGPVPLAVVLRVIAACSALIGVARRC